MDKLTAIKIKDEYGTYSDEIPISVLSENVEWDNTHTLVDVLGSIDVDAKGTIQDQIDKLSAQHTIYTRTLTTTVGGAIEATRTGNVVTLRTAFNYAFPIKDHSYTVSLIPVGYRPTRNAFFAVTPTSRSGDNMLASDRALMAVIDAHSSDRMWHFNVASSTTDYREYAATLTYITADDYPADDLTSRVDRLEEEK